ncbi:hypothetical protein D8M30_14345 [Corynebacterium pseudodiphtheriticum]|nr:hypothetical protein D8M30_14345 [Corynebacterium pseudodiphtheriticum]
MRAVATGDFLTEIQLDSDGGIKLAAVAGLVAGFLQAAPLLKGVEVAVGPFGWLLVSGGFYVLAVLWFEWRCPVLLKRTLQGNSSTWELKVDAGCSR